MGNGPYVFVHDPSGTQAGGQVMYDETKAQHLLPSHRLKKIGKVTPEQLREAGDQIIAEFFEDEMKDFDENSSEDHPYHALRMLHAYLYGGQSTRTGTAT